MVWLVGFVPSYRSWDMEDRNIKKSTEWAKNTNSIVLSSVSILLMLALNPLELVLQCAKIAIRKQYNLKIMDSCSQTFYLETFETLNIFKVKKIVLKPFMPFCFSFLWLLMVLYIIYDKSLECALLLDH